MCYSALIRQDLKSMGLDLENIAVRESFDLHDRRSKEDPKHFPPLAPRIFPGSYTGVLSLGKKHELSLKPMRYGAYPPGFAEAKAYTTYNARRDNLSSPFWKNAFAVHHGFVVLQAFYEWVEVKDLVKTKRVTIAAVREVFAQQSADRKAKILAQGKSYKPTSTESKDAMFRKIIIEFKADSAKDLLVPVIYSERILDDGHVDYGFAIVTDDPPPEIKEAGHDRCPIFLQKDALKIWLDPGAHSPKELVDCLDVRPPLHFTHALPEAA